MSSQTPGSSLVPPYALPYSTPIDVSRKFGLTDDYFSSNSFPTFGQVQDIIVRKDSLINQWAGHDFLLHQTTEYYDAIGVGRMGGVMLLRNTPVISVERVEYRQEGADPNQRAAWIPGVAGGSSEAAGVLVGPTPQVNAEYYFVYPEQAKVRWGRLFFSFAQKYRVTYSYGFPSVPDWVRDLSAWLAGQECLTVFAGKFVPPDPARDYKSEFEIEIQRLFNMVTHRPLVAVG